MKVKACLLLLWTLLTALPAAGHPGDSIEASVLTCAPGPKVYELYGHTALRLHDLRTGADSVYNYGMFDSRKPHFVWHFILGETDYELDRCDFRRFAASYLSRGRSIDEQVLDLTAEEKWRLLRLLETNARPENKRYRYNYLYDNCTTRAVEQISRSVAGRLEYRPAAGPRPTYRDIVHEFSADHPWLRFGQDLLLGCEVDTALSREGEMFSPVYAEAHLQGAVVVAADGTARPLVKLARRYPAAEAPAEEPCLLTPMACALLLLLLTAAVSLREARRRRAQRWFDYLLMLAQGGTGCIVALLFFCSAHPAVGSNWLIVWLNPLPLLFLPVKIWRDRRGLRDLYSPVAAAVTGVFLLAAAFLPQSFPPEILLLAAVLLWRHLLGSLRRSAAPGGKTASAPRNTRKNR